jgi:pyruvate dehydrogenase E2 component (dihydrolipoamide acetyltransferase)
MAEPIFMIALSPTMNEGVIAEWVAKEGQLLKSGDALCEVETDKATMAYESPVSGSLLKILLPAGSSAVVGQLIAVMGKAGEDWQATAAAHAGKAPSAAALGSAPGAAPVESAPAAPEPPAGAAAPSPAPSAILPATTQSAFPALGPAAQDLTRPPAYAEAVTAGLSALPAGLPPSSPLARKLAREKGVDLRGVRGSGPRGRVVARDIESYAAAQAVRAGLPAAAGEAAKAFAGAGVPAFSYADGPAPAGAAAPSGLSAGSSPGAKGLRSERVPLSKMRSIIASRLSQSYAGSPHYFVRVAIDMERLLELRSSVNAGRDKALSLNAFIMKLVAAALERHPVINASWEGDAIRYLPSADLGLAVALEGGLITPVVRSCEARGIADIDGELSVLVAKARAGALKPEEYGGASFTISNLGSFGVEEFTAIINPPGSAILALGAIAKEAVVVGDDIVARRVMRATLSSDHRVIDGAQAAAFMAELKALFEEPARALM